MKHLLSLCCCLAITATVFAQPLEENEDFPPGLHANYMHEFADSASVERIDANIAFDWKADSPDVRLSSGKFSALWNGMLLLRRAETYRFHAYVQGKVEVSVDGKTVLEGERKQAGWVSGPATAFRFGLKPFQVKFQKTESTAQVKLFWSADSFQLEPIPANLFFRETPQPKLFRVEHGKALFDAHRCNRCHTNTKQIKSSPAADLSHVSQMKPAALLEKLLMKPKDSVRHKMPHFGFSEQEAKAVTSFLLHSSKQIKLPPVKLKAKEKQADVERKGIETLHAVGCLACHQFHDVGTKSLTGGGDLTGIGSKRSVEWLHQWLKDPKRLNADHQMPVIKLSDDERRHLAFGLASSRFAHKLQNDLQQEALIDQGRKLVESHRCAACHRIPGVKPVAMPMVMLSKPASVKHTCLNPQSDRIIGRPSYPQADREALLAYLKSYERTFSPISEWERGQKLLSRRNCIACHQRNKNGGFAETAGRIARKVPSLSKEVPLLVPPSLTAVGDKLHTKALAEAVAGQQKSRLTWLKVRMPRFAHSDTQRDALLHHLIAQDRIPDGAPANPFPVGKLNAPQQEVLHAGHTLVGVKGFSCIACHKVGDYEPKQVALGTRGSDLVGIGDRMRRDFFLRWTRSPIRIIPGMEMPTYVKPVPGLLDGKLETELVAIWEALNDPKFTPPNNPTQVEQFLTVAQPQLHRIQRDVFTLPKSAGGGSVPNSFAVGFNNGHSVLFDLDTFTVRQWNFGDFATQRTQGKSWFWDLAGVPVMQGFSKEPQFALQSLADPKAKLILPHQEGGRIGEMKDYYSSVYWADQNGGNDNFIGLAYQLNFLVNGERTPVFVKEVWVSITAQDGSCWSRAIRSKGVPEGYRLVIRKPSATPVVKGSGAEISARNRHGELYDKTPDFLPITEVKEGEHLREGLNLFYVCTLKRPRLKLKPTPILKSEKEAVTTVPGFTGIRLPIDASIMPTGMDWLKDGRLIFTSLKGHVYIATDTNGDGLEDSLKPFEQGLSAPFGIRVRGDYIFVSHKPEVLALADLDRNDTADIRGLIATGWGHTDDYHDWTTGLIEDSQKNLYIGLGSDYAQKNRPKEQSKWRGKVLKITFHPPGESFVKTEVTPIGHSFRYPTGLAINADGDIFVSDNQGVQNTFNEINHLVKGKHYGVPSRHETLRDVTPMPPAIQVPHPWSRSVNGLFFLNEKFGEMSGHGIGCEYDSRFLIRFTTQKVGDVYQGATYYFSKPNQGAGGRNFVGPLVGAVSPKGEIYIGSIHDSGWLGGRNTGAITKLKPNNEKRNGILELTATADGFAIEFFRGIKGDKLRDPKQYTITGYTRKWQGSYSTPDSGRHRLAVKEAKVTDDGKRVQLIVPGLKPGHVYEVSCGDIDSEYELFPATGHYTLHVIPAE